MEPMKKRGLKTPEDFAEALRDPGRYGVTPHYVLGYAKALYDTKRIDMREAAGYARMAINASFEKVFGKEETR